jgi:periplasmic divalent cation tolerance protein
METRDDIRLIVTTASSRDEAKRIARALVEERLAACATLIPGAHSIYNWQGAVEEADETIVLLKTTAERIDALEIRLKELHSYETPELLSLRVDAGSHAYLQWLQACTQR